MFHDHRLQRMLDGNDAVVSTGVARACYYPQMLAQNPPMVITGGRIWSWAQCEGEGDFVLSAAGTNIPSKLSKRYEAQYPFDDTVWPGAVDIVFDEDYIYSIHIPILSGSPGTYTGPRVMRVNKALPTQVDSLICPDLRAGGEDAESLVPGAQCAVLNGFLYITGNGVASSTGATAPLRLWIIDLSKFSEDGVSTIELTTVTPVLHESRYMFGVGMCAAGGKILITTTTADVDLQRIEGRIFSYYPPDETITEDVTTHKLGRGCSDGAFGYFIPDTESGPLNGGHDNTQVQGAKVDASNMSVEYFDITDDPAVSSSDAGNRPWSDGTTLNFLANNAGGTINAPYLAKRNLADLSVVEGRNLTSDFDNLSYRVYAGASDGSSYSYLKGTAVAGSPRHGPGCMLRVSSAYAVFYPPRQSPPSNDDFPGSAIKLAQSKTFHNEFATKQDGEPDHNGDPGGKSLWWTFTAPADGFYVLSAPDSINAAIYIGDTIPALSEVGRSTAGEEMRFAGTTGQKFRIAIDGHFDPPTLVTTFGSGTITVTQEPAPPNDNFANAAIISPGQTKTANNRLATAELGEPDHAGEPALKSLWYTFTVDEATTVQVSVESATPTRLAVYTEGSPAGVSGLIEVNSAAEAGGTDDDYASWMAAL